MQVKEFTENLNCFEKAKERGLFSFCFLHKTVFGNGQIAITHNLQTCEGKGLERKIIN